jgi:hypothetical protein
VNVPTRLYVIESGCNTGYWARSSQHGTGWVGPFPKQAFTISELLAELRWMVEHDMCLDLRVRELTFRT